MSTHRQEPANRPRLTPQEFEAAIPAMGRLSEGSIAVAREVLVNGLGYVEAGAKHNVTKQRANFLADKFLKRARAVPDGWEHVDVWLPPEMAEMVRNIAQQARDNLAATSPD